MSHALAVAAYAPAAGGACAASVASPKTWVTRAQELAARLRAACARGAVALLHQDLAPIVIEGAGAVTYLTTRHCVGDDRFDEMWVADGASVAPTRLSQEKVDAELALVPAPDLRSWPAYAVDVPGAAACALPARDADDGVARPSLGRPPRIDRETSALGDASVHSNFPRHSDLAARKHGFGTADVLELRRRMVNGHEDVFVGVTLDLPSAQGQTPAGAG